MAEKEQDEHYRVEDRRFWVRRERGELKEGERAPRKSDLPSYVEQLQEQMEASRSRLKQQMQVLRDEESAFRQRVSDEMEKQLEIERFRLAEILLEVMDYLDVAIRSADDAERKTALFGGIELTRKDLESRLKKLGVERFESVGQPFDPEKHEAVMTRDCGPGEDGIVLEESRPGYHSAVRLIRPAQVVVGKALKD